MQFVEQLVELLVFCTLPLPIIRPDLKVKLGQVVYPYLLVHDWFKLACFASEYSVSMKGNCGINRKENCVYINVPVRQAVYKLVLNISNSSCYVVSQLNVASITVLLQKLFLRCKNQCLAGYECWVWHFTSVMIFKPQWLMLANLICLLWG